MRRQDRSTHTRCPMRTDFLVSHKQSALGITHHQRTPSNGRKPLHGTFGVSRKKNVDQKQKGCARNILRGH